jgi:hypothetical protein
MTLHPGILAGVTGADLCISWSGRMPEMLLLSNSTAPGRAFLEHALEVIAEVLRGRRRLLFVALAASDPDRYTATMRDSLAQLGIRVEGAHEAASLREATCAPGSSTAPLTWGPAPARTLPARRFAPRMTCRSSTRARFRGLA